MKLPIGTIINVLAIIIGGSLGLILNKNFPEKIKASVFQAIGLFTIVIGLQMAIKTDNPLIMVFSLIIGGIIGEFLNLEKKIDNASESIKLKLKIKDNGFTQGIVTSFLLFCVGSMTIVGSISEGISGDRTLLLTKSILDGFSSIALASSFGIGVIFSAFPVLVFQGGLTLLAGLFQNFINAQIITQLTAVGGVLILGIGINLLGIKKINVINLLPSLIIVVLITAVSMLI